MRAELPVDTVAMARFLIGKLIARDFATGTAVGRIVETEAYVVGDAACHAYRRMTPRNRSLFLEHGHAYVYRAYGVSWMLNVSSEIEGVGSGVLLRAMEPLHGLDLMRRNRGVDTTRDLARGPGRLAMALGVDRSFDGIDLCAGGPLRLAADPRAIDGHEMASIGTSVRIGITKDAERPLRFYLRGSVFSSGPRRLNV